MAQLSDNAIKQLSDFIEAESRRWVQEYIQSRRAVLAKRGILASGQLQDSFAFGLTKSVTSAVTNTVELAFDDYGRYVEMKRLNVPRGGAEYIDNLAAWIVEKGFADRWKQQFMQKRNLRTEPPDILQQMAWGMATNRREKIRRRPWYAKSKSAAVTDLFNRVAGGLPDIVMQEIKSAFNQ